MEAFVNGIQSIVTTYQPYIVPIAAACIVICGVLIAIPSDKTKESGKKGLIGVLIGAAIVLLATQFAADWTNPFITF